MQNKIHLNKGLLFCAIEWYFDELYEYKFTSNTDFINNEKKCAYIIKWISKVQPIQINPQVTIEQMNKHLIFINALFGIFVGIATLGIKDNQMFNIRKISPSFYKDILLSIRTSDIGSKQLSHFIRLVNAVTNNEFP